MTILIVAAESTTCQKCGPRDPSRVDCFRSTSSRIDAAGSGHPYPHPRVSLALRPRVTHWYSCMYVGTPKLAKAQPGGQSVSPSAVSQPPPSVQVLNASLCSANSLRSLPNFDTCVPILYNTWACLRFELRSMSRLYLFSLVLSLCLVDLILRSCHHLQQRGPDARNHVLYYGRCLRVVLIDASRHK